MSPEQKTFRVGAVTLGSMLLTLVLLAALLFVSDLRASTPRMLQELPTSSVPDGITAFALDTLPRANVDFGSKCPRTAYVVRTKAGTEVFVYTRNSVGDLTDPD